MGARLVAEVLHTSPATLTHRESWVLAVLAEDADDDSRTTQSSVEDPGTLRRARVSRPQMYAVLRELAAKGAVKRVASGQRHQVAAYTLLPMGEAPAPTAVRERPARAAAPAACPPAAPQPSTATTRPPPRRQAAAPDPEFDQFWQSYPRRVGKGTARTAWARAVRRGADPQQITTAAARAAAQWRAAHTESRFIPYPATWLNGERWDDEPEPPATHSQPALPGAPSSRYHSDPAERGIF